MKKRSNSRQGLSSEAQKWLRGEKCGFFEFKPDDELEALWLEHGDDSKMFWRREMNLPITLEDLGNREDWWLGSGDEDYGMESFFIHNYYSDEEKQTLWDSRGEKSLFRWKPGMLHPAPIQ